MPKVSVVIPVYNVAPYLEKCVRSVMQQTLKDIEIICVDDASSDDSPNILKSLAAQDGRVRIFTLPENLTANQARKNGVLASTGDIVMFLDGDDELLPSACETVLRAMDKHKTDVLHFGAQVINKSGVPTSRIQWNQNKIAPCLESIKGDLIKACFEENKFFFTLWNKAFQGDLARKAFGFIQDGRFPRAQDLYAVFFLLHFARSYQGIPDILLHYNFGTGITGQQVYELRSFERFCLASRVADAIRTFLLDQGAWKKYGQIATRLRENLLLDALAQWMNHLRPEDCAAGYDLLSQSWGAEELVAALAKKSINERDKFSIKNIARKVYGSNIISPNSLINAEIRKSKTIAFFYYRYHSGGVQRVISLLMPVFLRWGWNVILITEEHEPREEYPLPKNVKRVIIPPSANGENYENRADALATALRQHEVDVFNYHATSGQGCLFDLLLAKHLGCRVVFSRHELAFSSFLNNTSAPIWHLAVYALVDRLTVLTRMDEQYYRSMGVPAVFVPNPLPHLDLQPLRSHQAPPVILWVGRMDFVQKQCLEPIEIMREVIRVIPDAKLKMLGGSWSSDAEKTLRKRISELGLQKNVELLGYTPQPEKYYQHAACQLVTSSWENYPMIIEESRAFGLPLVLYEMPYLELLQSGKGYIAVDQLDRQAAANAIVHLLMNPSERERVGREAQAELASANNDLLEQRWQKILLFSPLAALEKNDMDANLLQMLMQNVLQLYERGLVRRQRELAELRKQIKESTPTATQMLAPIETTPVSSDKNMSSQSQPSPNLKTLQERKAKFGAIGALDFLIDREMRTIKKG